MKPVKILASGKMNTEHYLNAIKELGGIPVLNDTSELFSYDGLLLCGGNDVAPEYYGEAPNGSVSVDCEHDELEISLIKAFLEAKKPIMGICRGYQLLNVFFGGSLYQHLPEADLHIKKDGHDQVHTVTAVEDSILFKYYGREFSVNSAHHQAVKRLGEGLRATALWDGRETEAFEHITLPVFGVQWHPERMCFKNKRSDTVDGARLFEHFLSLCAK